MLQEAAWLRVKSGTCFSSWFNNVPINAALGFPPRGRWQADLKSSLSDCFNDSTAALSYTRRWSEAAFWAAEIRSILRNVAIRYFLKQSHLRAGSTEKKRKGGEFLIPHLRSWQKLSTRTWKHFGIDERRRRRRKGKQASAHKSRN